VSACPLSFYSFFVFFCIFCCCCFFCAVHPRIWTHKHSYERTHITNGLRIKDIPSFSQFSHYAQGIRKEYFDPHTETQFCFQSCNLQRCPVILKTPT
jgi:hypothetical protein